MLFWASCSYQLDATLLKTAAMPAINHMSHMKPSVDSSINRLSTLVSSHMAARFVTKLSAAPAVNHDDAVEADMPITSSTYVKWPRNASPNNCGMKLVKMTMAVRRRLPCAGRKQSR